MAIYLGAEEEGEEVEEVERSDIGPGLLRAVFGGSGSTVVEPPRRLSVRES